MKSNQLKIEVRVKKLAHYSQGQKLPQYQTNSASGCDACACLSVPLVLKPGERSLIPTGLAFEIPIGFEIQVRPRSGLAIQKGLTLLNTPGTIDADYRGEVKIIVINLGDKDITVQNGERIAQFVLAPVIQAEFVVNDDLSETARGAGGFGSTGLVTN
jgi:dUTP pyrophosphatase